MQALILACHASDETTPMRIITLNVQGLRQAAERGLFDWMVTQNADVVCLQDIREKDYQLDEPLFHPEGWYAYFFDAFEDGYSGTAIYSRHQPKAVMTGLGFSGCDFEGRFIQADFERVSVASISVPSGLGDDDKQDAKNEFMEQFSNHLRKTLRKRRDFIFCGTINSAHKPEDLSGWYVNQKNSGFLPEEREVLDEIFFQMEFCDAFRQVNKNERQFTWWPDYNRAFKLNEGARLDYQITTPNLRHHVRNAGIFREQRFSNHAPLIIDYTCDL